MNTIMVNPQNKNTWGNYTSTFTISDLMDGIKTLGLKVGDFTMLSIQAPILISHVRKCQESCNAYDFAMIYEKTPQVMVKSLAKVLNNASIYAGASVEEILRYYMRQAQSANNLWAIINDSVPPILKALDHISAFFHWKGDLDDYDDSTSLALKPTLLVLLWGALLMNLSGHTLSSSVSYSGMEHIARMALALTFAAVAGLTGYFHSGGTAGGIKSPTSFITTYFNSQNSIKDIFPSLYYRIPDELKFDTPNSFSAMTSSEKISAGKGMNMAYTFRVGDAFITTFEGKYLVSDDYMKDMMKKLWPLVSNDEADKMYRLYTLKQKIYKI